MALWGKKDEDDIPEELKGKTPQEIATMLREAQQLKTQLDTLAVDKTKTDTQLAEIQAQQAENLRLIEELKTNQKPPEKPVTPEPANPWIDPDKWLRESTQDTQNIALVSGVMSAKMYARQTLSQRDAKIFTKYEKEIDQVMQGYQPVQRIIPDNWVLALTLIKGRHDQEISKMERDGTDFFSEESSGGRPPEPEPEVKLTPDEEDACRRMHWDPKEYLKNRSKMAIASSEKGSIARFTNG